MFRNLDLGANTFLFVLMVFTLRVHFMLFGTYRINERKETPVRLSLRFKNAEINFYSCSLQFIEGNINTIYDWSADVMSDEWDEKAALKKLKAIPEVLVCDALLNQNIFSGVGNIIKNEVLYRIKVHPLSKVGALPKAKLQELVSEAKIYSFDFLEWKKKYVLKKNWLAHTKKGCLRCSLPIHKEYLGKTNRRTFYCSNCQEKWE